MSIRLRYAQAAPYISTQLRSAAARQYLGDLLEPLFVGVQKSADRGSAPRSVPVPVSPTVQVAETDVTTGGRRGADKPSSSSRDAESEPADALSEWYYEGGDGAVCSASDLSQRCEEHPYGDALGMLTDGELEMERRKVSALRRPDPSVVDLYNFGGPDDDSAEPRPAGHHGPKLRGGPAALALGAACFR